MADKINELESKLNELFVHNAPKLPDGGKKVLVKWAPVLSLLVGILILLSAWSLWHWARAADGVVNYANAVCNAYAAYGCSMPTSHYSVWLWLSVLFLAAEGLLYVLAYSGLKAHKKQGWNYLYYGALLNVLYAVVSLFAGNDVASRFVGALIGSAVGFYFLFQIRGAYLGGKKPAAPASPADSDKSKN